MIDVKELAQFAAWGNSVRTLLRRLVKYGKEVWGDTEDFPDVFKDVLTLVDPPKLGAIQEALDAAPDLPPVSELEKLGLLANLRGLKDSMDASLKAVKCIEDAMRGKPDAMQWMVWLNAVAALLTTTYMMAQQQRTGPMSDVDELLARMFAVTSASLKENHGVDVQFSVVRRD